MFSAPIDVENGRVHFSEMTRSLKALLEYFLVTGSGVSFQTCHVVFDSDLGG